MAPSAIRRESALLPFKGDSPAVAEAFAKVAPYVTNGLVTRRHVRPWATVAGEACSTPVHPSDPKAGAAA